MVHSGTSLVKSRILHIIDALDRTGAAQHLNLLARGLPPAEFEVQVCALSRGGPVGEGLARAGIPVHVIGRRWAADPTTFWRLLGYVKEFRPDSIHAWQAAGRAYAVAVAQYCRVPKLVAVWREVPHNRGPLQRAVDRWVGRRASRVVATCPAVRDVCMQQGIAPGKIAVIPGGVCKAAPPAATREQILDRLGLPQSARLIGWAGRLETDRGGKDAIWAADLLKVIRDDAHLLIFGAGPHHDRLVRFRDQVEIADKVHFLGDRGDLEEFLPHLDQFWSTRRLPGQSQAVLEAMAAAVPVVATDVAGMRELIEHETTGCLFAPGHRAGLARWAEYLLNHPDVARQIGAAGRQRVEREFSVEKMVQRWRDEG
jgi:glycosyltransferase involved in cell wall biosynthesis